MVRKVLLPIMVLLLVGASSSADALVLCVTNGSGIVVALDSCKAGQTQVAPASVGLQGPPGPQGPAGPAGSAGATGPKGTAGTMGSEVFFATNATVFVPQGPQFTTVIAKSLPAGTYVVEVSADVFSGYIEECTLPNNTYEVFTTGGRDVMRMTSAFSHPGG